MRWDRFFEDLEGQLDSEWEAERAALDSEAERLRMSRLALRERLQALRAGPDARVGFELCDGQVVAGVLTSVGTDWAGMTPVDATGPGPVIVSLPAVATLTLAEGDLLGSARASQVVPRGLAERMTLGYLLRDLARRRIAVTMHLRGGRTLGGTIDRALSDHLDLALHDVGEPRRASAVSGMRVLPFAAIAWLHLESSARL